MVMHRNLWQSLHSTRPSARAWPGRSTSHSSPGSRVTNGPSWLTQNRKGSWSDRRAIRLVQQSELLFNWIFNDYSQTWISIIYYIHIWKYLYGFVSRRCHSIHGSDSSIVRYENEGLCGYVLLNSDFIFLATHTTKIRFHVWICRCPAHSSRQKYLEPHF